MPAYAVQPEPDADARRLGLLVEGCCAAAATSLALVAGIELLLGR